MYVTAQPLDSFGPYNNIFVGVARTPGASIGEAFVLVHDEWQLLGQAIITVSSGLGLPITPALDSEIFIDGRDGGGFAEASTIADLDEVDILSDFVFNFRAMFPTQAILARQATANRVRQSDIAALSLLYRTLHPDSEFAVNWDNLIIGAGPFAYMRHTPVRGLSLANYVLENKITERGPVSIPSASLQRRWGIDFEEEYTNYRISRQLSGLSYVDRATFSSLVSPIWEADAMARRGEAITGNIDLVMGVLSIAMLTMHAVDGLSCITWSSRQFNLPSWAIGRSSIVNPNGTITAAIPSRVSLPWVVGVRTNSYGRN